MYAELKSLFTNFKVNGVTIPVALINYDGHGESYVVYREYDKDNSYSSDDEISGYVTFYDFDVYAKSNFLPIVEAIKSKLKQAGWTWQPRRDSPDMYEADTGYFHKTICFAYPIQIADEQNNNQN